MIRLVLLIIIFPFHVFCQENVRITMDYGKCYYGLSTNTGKVIVQPVFESIEESYLWIPNSANLSYNQLYFPRYWKAQKNGFYGILNYNGEIRIPFEYETLLPSRDRSYIVKKNGKCQILDSVGKVLLDSDYTEIKLLETGYAIKQNGLYGYMNNDFDVMLQPKFENITNLTIQEWQEGRTHIISSTKFQLIDGESKGIFDIEHGVVVPLTTNYIYIKWTTNCHSSSATYVVVNNNERSNEFSYSGVINPNGNWVIPYGKHQVTVCAQPLDSCGNQNVTLAYEIEQLRVRVHNVATLKNSGWYARMQNYQLHTVFYEDEHWGVLDENFKEIFRSDNRFIASIVPHEIHNVIYERPFPFGFEQIYHYTFICLDQIIYILSQQESQAIEYPGIRKNGIINYHSGKYIPPKYDRIYMHFQNEQQYFWAVNDDYENKRTIVHVFNSSMKKVESFTIEGNEDAPDFNRNKKENMLMIVEKNGLIGARNMAGKLVVPVKYTEWQYMSFYQNKISKDQGTFVFRDKNNKCGIINTNGSTIVPFIYDRLDYVYDDLINAYVGDSITIYNTKYDKLIENVDRHMVADALDEFGQYILQSSRNGLTNKMTRYCIRGNELWIFNGQIFEKVNQNTFVFEKPILSIFGYIDIDQNGQIVKIRSKDRLDTKGKGSIEYDPNEPVKQNSTPNRQPNKFVPIYKKSKFIWKASKSGTDDKLIWHLYDSTGTSLSNFEFEFPVYEDHNFRIFKVGGYFGLFDDSLNIVLQPEYSYIYYSHGDYLLQKDNLWGIYNMNGQFLEPQFSSISLKKYQKGRFVFNNNKVGIIDSKFSYLIALTDSSDLVRNKDLIKILDFRSTSGDKAVAHEGYVYNQDPRSVYARINSSNLIFMERLNSTENKTLNYSFTPQTKLLPVRTESKVEFSLRDDETRALIEIGCHSPNYFSYELWSRPWSHKADYSFQYQNIRPSDRAYYTNQEHYNFRIENGVLVPIDFKDIFKTDASSTQKLNQLIIDKLNQLQPFGNNCQDINSKVEILKQNFYMSSYEMYFIWPERNGFILRFYKKEILPFLIKDIWK